MIASTDDYFPKLPASFAYNVQGYWNKTNKFFYQHKATSKTFNLDLTISITSYDAIVISTEGTSIEVIINSDGSTTYTNQCLIKPLKNKLACSYLVDSN